MSLTTGALLGTYEMQTRLGQGGMGEVYRARDARLARDVAIKILPDAFAGKADRVARFVREARTLAALNHPNIAQIYGLVDAGEGTGVHALVMELVEGEDLGQRLAAGPLPLEDALAIARQIASALEAAHAQGIVHRDLKPANIKVTPNGTVKVLDFGLAKAMDPFDRASDCVGLATGFGPLANSPTMTSPAMTAMGVILGTAAYMAPEQAKGAAVDRRADIWAFGVVLYEMLTGRRPFDAPTTAEIVAQILTRAPDFAQLPAATPPQVRELLRRCLERDRARRLHDIADGRLMIEDVQAGGGPDHGAAQGARPAFLARSRRRTLAWLAVVALALSSAWAFGRGSAAHIEAAAGAMNVAVHLAVNQEVATDSNPLLAFSPEGDTLVFGGTQDGHRSLFRRRLTERTAEPIPGTEGGNGPFFSPDGRWLGFVAQNRMWKIQLEGGRPFPLTATDGSGGAVWLADNSILFAPIYSEGLFRVSADGGIPQRLTTPDRKVGELGHWYPSVLPDGRHVIFTAFRTPVDRSRIGVLDLETHEVRWIVDGGFFGRYVPSGHLVYAQEHRLYARPFDASTATIHGPAIPVLDDVRTSQTAGYAQLAVSRQGTLAYVTESLGNPLRELVWLDRSGRVTPATNERRRYLSVNLSLDDQQAAATIQGESRDLWVVSLRRGTASRITSAEITEYDPRWSRDGRELFYVVDRPPFDLFRIAVGAVDAGRPIWKEPAAGDTNGIAVSPDGRTIAYMADDLGTGANLYARPLDGSAPARPIRATRADERGASFSPDGRYVAYQSDETGRPEIYVVPLAEPGEPIAVSADGGTEPVWAANWEIFYRRDNEVRVVTTHLAPRISFSVPRILFTLPMAPYSVDASRVFDVTHDGARLLAITVPIESRPRQIDLVTGWVDGLRRMVPPGSVR